MTDKDEAMKNLKRRFTNIWVWVMVFAVALALARLAANDKWDQFGTLITVAVPIILGWYKFAGTDNEDDKTDDSEKSDK